MDWDEINLLNSNIFYCIVDDNDICINYIYFYINQFGVVLCIKELDYEELFVLFRGKVGEFRLRIKVCDYGNLFLCLIVILIIFVQVKEKNNV